MKGVILSKTFLSTVEKKRNFNDGMKVVKIVKNFKKEVLK